MRLPGVTRVRPAAALVLLAVLAGPAAAAGSVAVSGASRPTLCAEEDNVSVELRGGAVVGFRIEALHPAYIDAVRTDSTAPDFSHCDMRGDPSYAFAPRTTVLHEDSGSRLVGHVFASFWRPTMVPLLIGDRREDGLHLVQLMRRQDGRWIEVLVLYPADGYWRAKPLPPPQLPDSAFGSSFLVGPVEHTPGPRGRPLVELAGVRFEPAALAFTLAFARGGEAVLQVAEATRERLVLDVRLAPPVGDDRPFAALRSMFVSPEVADVATVAWRDRDGAPWRTLPVLDLARAKAVAVRFGRSRPSAHNTSAPDLLFSRFR